MTVAQVERGNQPAGRWRRLARVALVAGLVAATPFLFVIALFVIGGMNTVHFRTTSPDGQLEARIETQGGSMQFPMTALYVRTTGGWFGAAGDDCAVARWSEAETPVIAGMALEWGSSRRLLVSGTAGRLPLPAAACGIAVARAR